MSIDFDLSIFRLVKSFAAVEISRNVGISGSDEGAGERPADPVRSRDETMSAPVVRPGLSGAAGNPARSGTDQIPDRLDDDMRAALDQGLEGPEREAVRWQHGQRNAALSLSGLARPRGSPDTRQSIGAAPDQMAAQEPDTETAAVSPRTRSAMEGADVRMNRLPADVASSGQGLQSGTTTTQTAKLAAASLPVLTSELTDDFPHAMPEPIVHTEAATDTGTEASTADSLRGSAAQAGGVGLEKPQLLLSSTVLLLAEAQAFDMLLSMVEAQQQDLPATNTADLEPDGSGQDLSVAADQPAVQKAALQDLMRLSRASVASTSLMAEQAEVPDRRSGGEEPLAQRQGAAVTSPAQADLASLPRDSMALDAELPDALPGTLSEGYGSGAVSAAGKGEPSSADKASSADDAAPALVAAGSGGQVTVAGAKVLELLNALVALSADEGSADWQSLSSVILNAAMIPGWPPPRPIENPAGIKQDGLLAQLDPSAEPEEAPMTPEHMLAYLMSIGANLRLLRALQELVGRVEKKNGPALLAWLAGLVSALKLIEKSVKDMIEDGVELPEWLAELGKTAKGPRRRKQFHI